MQFTFSKYHTCSTAKRTYIDLIICHIKEVQANKLTGDSDVASLLGIIVHNCASRVQDRFTKLGKAWTSLKKEAVEWTEPPAAMIEAPLMQFYDLEHPQATRTHVEH